jgi:sugar lactone lactonase YvrE
MTRGGVPWGMLPPMAPTEVLVDGLVFGEGPRWHDGRLWFSDMHDRKVKAIDAAGKVEDVLEVPGDPSGLGWLPDGRLLVVSMTDRRLLRLDPGGLSEHADLSKLASYHCNDMVTDARGRSYVGNFGFDLHANATPRTAELVLVNPEGDARIVADELSFPNGSVITPDEGTLVVGESFGARLTAFDIAEDGSLSNRRVWAQLEGAVPDGICLDAEGAIWVASPVSNEVLRVREGGAVTDRIPLSRMAIACMLGGPDRRTLFVCTSETIDPAECIAKRSARIETTQVEVPGAGLP